MNFPESQPKTIIIVSRRWKHPQIRVTVDKVGISVSMMIEDFLDALGRELEARGTKTAQNALDQAAADVIAGMKDETTRAM